MRRIFVTAVVLLSVSVLYAQRDSVVYKHEIRASLGESVLFPFLWLDDENEMRYSNFSFSWFYRPVKYFWTGVNFVNYLGEKIYYHWREYDVDGGFEDFSKSKMKYCAIIAPEIRISFVNKEAIILYGALSGGIGIENGYDNREKNFPVIFSCFHLTFFGLTCNFGKNNNIFLGGEFGIGFKGLGSIHGGYRF